MLTQEMYHTARHNSQYWSHFDTRRDGVAILDAQGTILYLNAAWKHLIGVRDAEAFHLGNNYLEILNAVFDPNNKTNLKSLEESLQKVLQGKCDCIELEYPHNRGGQWRWFLVRLSYYPLEDGDGVLVEQFDISGNLYAKAVGYSAIN